MSRSTFGKGLAAAALELNRAQEAARWYGVAVTQVPDDVEAWVGLGEARVADGRRDEARVAFERALALDPDNGWLQTGVGWCHLRAGRLEEAEAVEAAIKELHSYELPEILAFDIKRGEEGFLHWIYACSSVVADADHTLTVCVSTHHRVHRCR